MKFRSRTGGLTVVCLASCLVAVGFAPAWADKFVSAPGTQTLAVGHVAILGQVTRSGVYELPQGGLTLAALVQLSGGLGTEASGNVRVIRKGRGGFQTFYSPQVRYDLMDGDILIFDRRQHSVAGAAVRTPGTQTSLPQRGQEPSQVTVAVANLIARPVVLDLPPDYATLRGLLHLLRQPLPPNASLVVMSPGRAPEVVRLASTSVMPAFVTGSVIVVVDPTAVISQNLPQLPNVIRPQEGAASSVAGPYAAGPGGSETAPRSDAHSGNFAGAANRTTTRSVTNTWNGGVSSTRSATRTQEPIQEPSNPGLISPDQLNPAPINAGQNPARAGSPPMLAIPGAVPQSSALPNPTSPFSDVPSSDGRAESLAPMSFPANGIGPVAAEPAPLMMEAGAKEVPVPDPRAVPLPDEDPELTANGESSKLGKRIDLAAGIAAGLLTLIGLAVWLQRRMNASGATQDTQATPAIPESPFQFAAPAATAPVRPTPAKRPVAPVARTASTRGPTTAAPGAAGHPVPRPHFAPAATPVTARTSQGSAPYDVVMPPESSSVPTKNLRQSPIPSTSGAATTRNAAVEEKTGTSGLLDRVLASVHGSRLR